jgi:K+-sensing histidine kinase KdpD
MTSNASISQANLMPAGGRGTAKIYPSRCAQARTGSLELIGNALKFTPEGGKVSIVTRNEASGKLVIEVNDTGIGIPADALSRIFSPFEQGDSSINRRYGGLGLGLSIARTLIKAHGGTLEAASEGLDKGAKFTARFKIDDSTAEAREDKRPFAAKRTSEHLAQT